MIKTEHDVATHEAVHRSSLVSEDMAVQRFKGREEELELG